jgi:hypothetical protein
VGDLSKELGPGFIHHMTNKVQRDFELGQRKSDMLHLDEVQEKWEAYRERSKADLSLDYEHLTHIPAKEMPAGDSRMWHYTLSDKGEKIREALTKNLNYWPTQCGRFGADKSKGEKENFIHMAQEIMGYSAVVEMLNKLYHAKYGSQMVVEECVSRDLSFSDMEHVGIENVPFPRESLEFFFEDSNLPTILCYRGTLRNQAMGLGLDLVHCNDSEADNDSINFWVEGHAGAGMAFRASSHNWNEMLGASNSEVQDLKGSIAFADEEWEQLKIAFRLCIKVLAYASIPRMAPKIVSKKALKHGGRPHVKGRPQTEILKVVYLPEITRERQESEKLGGKHAFRGRRGVLRFYKHERYKNMKGKYQYLPPLLGPNGELPKVLYKVRKGW